MALSVEIVSPTKIIFKGEASEVVLPSINGEAGVLPQHADYMTQLALGDIVVKSAAGIQNFSVTGGVARVEKDVILVLVEETAGIQ